MQSSFQSAVKRIYPFIMVLVFWGISFAQVFKPDISLQTIETNFWGHDKLIEYFNTLRLRLGDHVFPNVIIGDDGWMYYTGERSIDDFQGSNPFSENGLTDYQRSFDNLYERLQQQKILLFVVVAPDKNTIYPQYIPENIKKTGGRSRLDQFIEYSSQHGRTPVIDLRSELIQESKTADVYYKTNSHWNSAAHYIVYNKMISELSHWYPALVPHPETDFITTSPIRITHDIPPLIGMPNITENYQHMEPVFEVNTSLKTIPLSDGTMIRLSGNQDQNLPSALIYHDSFLDEIIPLLEPQFRETTSIPMTAIQGVWNLKWIDQVHPDIVIIEFAERFMNLDNYADFLQ
jgi:alginate O-acetyltransferase complex protein AlgJ